MKPYRVERGTAHFDVSTSDFDDFTGQINDAIAFLRSQAAEIRLMMNEPSADGVLDFAIEWRDVAAQFDTFPAELVREASNLGLALDAKGDRTNAIAEYQRAIQCWPENAEAHNTLGWALRRSGNVNGAITEFRASLRLKPDFTLARDNLNAVLKTKGTER